MRKRTKTDTHARILKVAAKRFRELGLDGIGVADVMKQAGVTVGAFYKHFKSRDELVVEALGTAFKDLDAWEKHAESLAQLLENYLTEYHRDNPGAGCAMGALLGDMSRASKSAKTVYTTRVKHSLAVTAGLLPSEESADKRGHALLILASLLGALNLSRAVSDPSLSREILEQVRRQLVDLTAGDALSKRGTGRKRQKRMQSTS
ncbi:MAG TPA: TetR/AcrR family transcriptional regulator [Candidatus Acidoferrales bacterium]|nr:TetR/AcrR family transcriptional regulator [Candidatus Acidoferrales bacterium]